jgi:hypothetical protein
VGDSKTLNLWSPHQQRTHLSLRARYVPETDAGYTWDERVASGPGHRGLRS